MRDLLTGSEKQALSRAARGMSFRQIEACRMVFMGFSGSETASVLQMGRSTVRNIAASLPGKRYLTALAGVADSKAVMMGTVTSATMADKATRALGKRR